MQKDINIEKYDFDEFEKEKKPYTMLLTEVIQTIKNPQAFLIWAFLQSLPTDWVPSKVHIMNHFDLSERVYQRLMSYLNQSNLIEYRRNRNCDGTLGKIKLIVLSGIKFNPGIEINHTAKNGGVVNNGSISIQNVHLHQAAILPHPGQTTRVDFGDHTKTIDLQRQELKKQIEKNINIKKENSLSPIEYQETYYPTKTYIQTRPKFSIEQIKTSNPHNIPQQMIEDWLTNRKAMKSPLTETTWNRLNKQLAKCPNALEAFEEMVARGWKSINPEWLESVKKEKSKLTDDLNWNLHYEKN